MVSDPIPGAKTLSYFIVGQDWVTVPYAEGIRNGKNVAIFADLGQIENQIKVYMKADDGKTTGLSIRRTIKTYQSYYNITTYDMVQWWRVQ